MTLQELPDDALIALLKGDFGELFKYALQLNASIILGGLALINDNLVLRDSLLLQNCDPRRFVKSLTYIAAKADELEEVFVSKNIN